MQPLSNATFIASPMRFVAAVFFDLAMRGRLASRSANGNRNRKLRKSRRNKNVARALSLKNLTKLNNERNSFGLVKILLRMNRCSLSDILPLANLCFETSARAASSRWPYGTPEGQTVSQQRQPRQ